MSLWEDQKKKKKVKKKTNIKYQIFKMNTIEMNIRISKYLDIALMVSGGTGQVAIPQSGSSKSKSSALAPLPFEA
ncbi:hypothetical protein P7M41_26380 [Vibrio parahaemolyticus]|nr:hypothetical protein [Vibrio parahaemolyticus]